MSSNTRKIDVLIVGAFKHKKGGATGGVLFACKSLIESRLKEKINWIKVDSTGSIPPPNVFWRAIKAAKRVFLFLFFLITRWNIKSVILFSSSDASFVEKGIMCLIAKGWGKRVLFAPRSGSILINFESKRFRIFGKYVLKKADIVICQGQSWKDYFLKLCDGESKPDKFVVIHKWINSAEYKKKEVSNVVVKETVFLFLGWTIKDKGLFDIIEAARVLKEKNFFVKVIIAGDGIDRFAAEKLVKEIELDQFISFVGWVQGEKKHKMLMEADVFILPSYFEGFPNSVLEAMASGLPVIVTDVGAVTELVDGTTGLIVTAGDVNKIVDAMILYCENTNLRVEHGDNGYFRIKNNFDIDSAVVKFEEILVKNNL